MKVFIYVDQNKIVRCIASDESNIWKDAAWGDVNKYHVDMKGTVGDEYNFATDEWTSKPENHAKLTPEQEAEKEANKYIQKQQLVEAKKLADADSKTAASAELQRRIDAL